MMPAGPGHKMEVADDPSLRALNKIGLPCQMPGTPRRRPPPSVHREIACSQLTGSRQLSASVAKLPPSYVERLDRDHDALPSLLAAIDLGVSVLRRCSATFYENAADHVLTSGGTVQPTRSQRGRPHNAQPTSDCIAQIPHLYHHLYHHPYCQD
ncbi:hypothetical protein T492DRAFT_82510 [Pavlovales sp. CCMP2436]|nr:hypothetical protein T492DRAFT_82510 [Pavlovales sp. CCMP2436]